jgi:methionine salvage enolase-phosphatase E1
MITTAKNPTKEEWFQGWAKAGLYAIEMLKKHPDNHKLTVLVKTAAACCAELDRGHKREETQTLQSYVWEQGYLSGEDSYERYEQSGYFKEKYRKAV